MADLSRSEPRVIELPRIPDPRGSLTFVQAEAQIPFRIRRAYWIYDVPGGERRGGHAYRELEEFIVALSGSFEVRIDDESGGRVFTLNRSYLGLYVPRRLWRQLENFSTNAVCLILASRPYEEHDYIRDRAEFEALVREASP